MSCMAVKFLDKEYSIPEDVLTYIDLLGFTENVKQQLVNAFVRKLNEEIRKGNVACLDDKDLSAEIEQQVGKFIAKLCDNGIFNRTINDYLRNNKGYQLFSDVNKAALEKMKSLLIREMDSWQAGFENALQKKESSVTGMGFSIWSSSFINHAIYAAMEASTVDKQEKAAAVQYQKDMNELRSRLDSQYGKEKSAYVHNTYIPNMEAALTVFAYELLDKYLADLIASNKFEGKTLEYVDIGRSNDLLKNLTLSNNKKAILENAFASCPYNIAVYMQAMKYDLLDYDSFQAAKVFKQSNIILSFLKSNWGDVSYPHKFHIDYHCVDLWALFTDTNQEAILFSLTEQYVNCIIKGYEKIAEMLRNEDLCRSAIKGYTEDTILAGDGICITKAHSHIDTIVSRSIWNQLVDQCGHTDLLDRIKKHIDVSVTISSKDAVDEYLLNQLTASFKQARLSLADQIAERREKLEQQKVFEAEKAEKEKIVLKVKEKRIRKRAVAIVVVAVILIAAWIGLSAYIEAKREYEKDLTWYNIEFASSFLGKELDEDGNLSIAPDDYEVLSNDMILFGIPGRFSHGMTSSLGIVDILDWVTSESVDDFNDILNPLTERYGDDYRVQHYNDAAGDAYMWKNVAKYEYVICWDNEDGTVFIRWILWMPSADSLYFEVNGLRCYLPNDKWNIWTNTEEVGRAQREEGDYFREWAIFYKGDYLSLDEYNDCENWYDDFENFEPTHVAGCEEAYCYIESDEDWKYPTKYAEYYVLCDGSVFYLSYFGSLDLYSDVELENLLALVEFEEYGGGS